MLIRVRFIVIIMAMVLVGCASTRHVPVSGTQFRLDRCPPLPNCVSSTSSTPITHVAPIDLSTPLSEASWKAIETVVTSLPGARVNESRYGYMNVTCFSRVLRFPDYLEVLVSEDGQRLDVRSQSQLGLFDFAVNRRRVEQLRVQLIEQELAVAAHNPVLIESVPVTSPDVHKLAYHIK